MTAHRHSTAWQALVTQRERIKNVHLRILCAEDPARAARFSVEAAGLFLDYPSNQPANLILAEPKLNHAPSTNALIERHRRLCA